MQCVINMMRPVGFPLLLLLAVRCGVFFVPSESFLHDEGMFVFYFLSSFFSPIFLNFCYLYHFLEKVAMLCLDSKVMGYSFSGIAL